MATEKVELAGYCRVSRNKEPKKTTIENQRKQIKAYAKSQGYRIKKWFMDEIVEGDAEKKPSFDEMMNHLEEFDGVIVRDLDRFGRKPSRILDDEETIREAGKRLIILEIEGMSLDTSTPTGEMLFGFMAVIARGDKRRILERLERGRKYYVESGGKLGRKQKKLAIPKKELEKSLEYKIPLKRIGLSMGINYRTVIRLTFKHGFQDLLKEYPRINFERWNKLWGKTE